MLRDELASRLFAHQRSVVDRLRGQTGKLIMWEMGTGKTIGGLAIDADIRSEGGGATLIVCPKSVLGVWEQALIEWMGVPHDRVFVIDPRNREPFQQALWENVGSKGDSRNTWFVMHWDVVSKMNFMRAGTKTRPMKFTHIIGDEIHRIAGRKSARTTAFKKIKASYKTALSGTPSDDKIQDLWSPLNWLYPGVWSAYTRFCHNYLHWVVPEPEKGYWIITGTKNLKGLREAISSYSDRVLLREVTDMPPKTYTTLMVDLPPAQRRPYDQMASGFMADVGQDGANTILSPQEVNAKQRLQQFALSGLDVKGSGQSERVIAVEPSAKLDALMELIADHPEEKFVVFSQFRGVLDLLTARLHKAKVPAPRTAYTGSMAREDRDAAVRDFQEGDMRVLHGTIGAMGTGITLTAARTVVFLDLSWNPADNEQAENRIFRIGQAGSVQVIFILARATVDEEQFEQVAEKADRLEELYGDAERGRT